PVQAPPFRYGGRRLCKGLVAEPDAILVWNLRCPAPGAAEPTPNSIGVSHPGCDRNTGRRCRVLEGLLQERRQEPAGLLREVGNGLREVDAAACQLNVRRPDALDMRLSAKVVGQGARPVGDIAQGKTELFDEFVRTTCLDRWRRWRIARRHGS